MSKRLHVGHLPFSTNEEGSRELFNEYGTVEGSTIVKDRGNGRSRGFGFVEMSVGADEAISALDGHAVRGRNLTVNEARPRG